MQALWQEVGEVKASPPVFWLWKGRNPMRHIERGEERRFLCGRHIGSGYDLDSSERTLEQVTALVTEPANARYLCEGCSGAIREMAHQPPADSQGARVGEPVPASVERTEDWHPDFKPAPAQDASEHPHK